MDGYSLTPDGRCAAAQSHYVLNKVLFVWLCLIFRALLYSRRLVILALQLTSCYCTVCCPRFLEPRNTVSPRMRERRTLSCNANASKQVKILIHWKYTQPHTQLTRTEFYCACSEYTQSQSPRAWLWRPQSGKYSVWDTEERRNVFNISH